MIFPTEIQEEHIDTFLALADAIVTECRPEDLKDQVHPNFPMDRLEEYCRLTPSRLPSFKEAIRSTVTANSTDSIKAFATVMTLLNSRIAAPALTGSLTLLRDMTIEQRQQVLISWRDSPLAPLRKLFKSMFSLAASTFARQAGELHNLAIGYPTRELREELYADGKQDLFEYNMIDRASADGVELYMPNVDVLIIGSGSGAGVVAHTLTQEGHKCLVLEKGKYYKESEFVFDDVDGMNLLYESGATLATTSQELVVLAGSTFGGGSTVNWSACIKTPFKVRKEWYDDYGMEWAASEEYDKCQEYVWNQMGATTQGIEHSFSNKVILEGGKKLGYHAAEVAQNNGNHPSHQCGFCYLGCKFGIKQGAQACWFKDAAVKGCQFLDQVKVVNIIHKKGKAIGVNCVDSTTGYKFKITGPKKFVVSGGTLNTPVVLQKSGFKNKHIGANLKLHPVTVVLANFGREVPMKPYEYPILSTVSNEVADLDGKAHGPRIETVLHAPFFEAAFLPWRDGLSFRQDVLKYDNTAAMLVITRDEGSGSVTYDQKNPDKLLIDYSVSKTDKKFLVEGVLVASDMLYVQGAKEIFLSQAWCPIFKSDKPASQRSIEDKDYAEWREKVKHLGSSRYGYTHGSAHQMSTCRISGKGPNNGAIDLKGRLYECRNVYVADASALPTASGANPMISTMTVARHIALDIAKDLEHTAKL